MISSAVFVANNIHSKSSDCFSLIRNLIFLLYMASDTTLHLCASVTKQYNLVLAQWVISLAGKFTGSLPPG